MGAACTGITAGLRSLLRVVGGFVKGLGIDDHGADALDPERAVDLEDAGLGSLLGVLDRCAPDAFGVDAAEQVQRLGFVAGSGGVDA